MNIYGIKDSANFTLKHKTGDKKGKVYLYADYATVSTNEWSSDQVYAKSKNVNAIRWDYNRNSTLKVDMEIFDLKWMAMFFGTEFVNGDKDILKREVLTVADNSTATISGTAIAGSLAVYTLDDDGLTNLQELIVGTPISNEGEYSIAESKITVNTSLAGKKIAVFYLEKKTGVQTLTIDANKYPENFEIVADTLIRSTDGNDQFVQIHYLNVKPKSQFTLTMDAANITTLSAEFDVLKDSASSDMATYTIYQDE